MTEFFKALGKLLFIIIPLTLAGLVVLAVVLPFIGRDEKQLPNFVRWFDNHDPLGDGLAGFVHYKYRPEDAPEDMYSFSARYNWLAIRNPINYFKYHVIGFKWNWGADASVLVEHIGPAGREVGDTEGKVGGILKIDLTMDGKDYYQRYYIKPYKLFGKTLCVRLLYGWKIWSTGLHNNGDVIQGVFTFNPFHPFRGDYV